MRKALRLKEAEIRYASGFEADAQNRAKADGLLAAIQIIDRLTKKFDTGEE